MSKKISDKKSLSSKFNKKLSKVIKIGLIATSSLTVSMAGEVRDGWAVMNINNAPTLYSGWGHGNQGLGDRDDIEINIVNTILNLDGMTTLANNLNDRGFQLQEIAEGAMAWNLPERDLQALVPNRSFADIKLRYKAELNVKYLNLTIDNIVSDNNSKLQINLGKSEMVCNDGNIALSPVVTIKGDDISALSSFFFGDPHTKFHGRPAPIAINGKLIFENHVNNFDLCLVVNGNIYSMSQMMDDGQWSQPSGALEIKRKLEFQKKIGFDPNGQGEYNNEGERRGKIQLIDIDENGVAKFKADVYSQYLNFNHKLSKIIVDASSVDINIESSLHNPYVGADDEFGIIKITGAHAVKFTDSIGGDDARLKAIDIEGNNRRRFDKEIFAKNIAVRGSEVLFTQNVSTNNGNDIGTLHLGDNSKAEFLDNANFTGNIVARNAVVMDNGNVDVRTISRNTMLTFTGAGEIPSIGAQDAPVGTLVIKKEMNHQAPQRVLTGDVFVNAIEYYLNGHLQNNVNIVEYIGDINGRLHITNARNMPAPQRDQNPGQERIAIDILDNLVAQNIDNQDVEHAAQGVDPRDINSINRAIARVQAVLNPQQPAQVNNNPAPQQPNVPRQPAQVNNNPAPQQPNVPQQPAQVNNNPIPQQPTLVSGINVTLIYRQTKLIFIVNILFFHGWS